ncbi:MAG: sialate O-acetylesterase [Acidobacteriaceae bacterium]
MKSSRIAFLLLCSLAIPATLHADVRLPHVLSDHAVLQRDRPIHIWGWATPGAHLTVRFHTQSVAAVANDLGMWSAYLAPESAGGPYTLTVSGDGPEVTLSDLLVGDVWIASGQSNMEMPLSGFPGMSPLQNSAQEIAHADNPRLRLLLVPTKSSDIPLRDQPAGWTLCTPQTAANFSAAAYFFGREIAARENVPVGLIDTTWGGTPADAWVSLDTLGSNPNLLPAFAARATFADQEDDMPAIQAEEAREDAAAKAAGRPAPPHPWHPDETSWIPAALYNGMIAPFTPLEVRGFLWYQGETNATSDRAPYYHALFSALIGDWRSHFAQGDLPFLYVQIASYPVTGGDWAMVRDAQRRTLDLTNTGMAVILDIGSRDNIHPPDKQDVGHRLALIARHMVYGENVAFASPLFRQATTEVEPDGTPAMRVWFSNAVGLTSRGAPIDAFEIAGADHHFVPAQARIDGETVIVSSPAVSRPVYVRYAWKGYVANNLFNAAGLPASTFTSEPIPTE